jgi:hypothetical protein
MTAGTENYAMLNFVTLVVTNMDSAKTELVSALLAGMENTAHSKDVREGKLLYKKMLKHLTNSICFNSCSSHGQCRVGGEGLFECRCNDGWDGIDCSLPLEKDCKDAKDNDKGQYYKINLKVFFPNAV